MRYRLITQTRSVKKRFLILCEGGKTEPGYFNAIRNDKMHSNALSALRIVVHDTKYNTAKELVAEAIGKIKEAKKEKNPFDEVWIVVDRDGYTKHPESFDRARANGIHIAFSSTCFEFWTLLHFEYTSRSFNNCDDVIRRLKQHLPDYEKSVDYYPVLKRYTEQAIQRSEQIVAHWSEVGDGRIWTYNPYSDVGFLVKRLLALA